MLPSRGVSSLRPASGLRQCIAGSRQATSPAWRIPSRQFSQVQRLGQPSSQWRIASAALRGRGSALPRLAPMSRNTLGVASGASRSLSLWPFGSNQLTTPVEAPRPESASNLPSSSTSYSPVVSESASTASLPSGSTAAQAPGAVDPFGAPSASYADPISSSFSADSFGDLDTSSILDIPEQIGYLKHLGLDFGWGPAAMCEWILEHVYIYTGLPWWGTIVATAIGIRLALFWPSMVGIQHAARMAVLQKDPEFIEAQKEMKALMWTPDQDRMAMMQARAKVSRLHKKADVSMLKTLAGPFSLIPLSYGMFRTLRAMSALPVPSLETGGLAWITDLTVYDPTYILPLVTCAFSYYTIKLHQTSNLNPTPQGEAMAKFMSWGLTPFMFLCTMWLPAACQLFFFAFAIASTAQQSLVVNPSVRQWAQLPPLRERPLLPSTTAASVKYEAPTRVQGFLDSANKNVDHLKTGLREFSGGDAKVAANKAQEYEKRRAQEEKEKLMHRAIEQRRKRAQHNQNKS